MNIQMFPREKALIIHVVEISETDNIVLADSSERDCLCCHNWVETDGKSVDWTEVVFLLSKSLSCLGLSNLQTWFSDVCYLPPYLSVAGCHFSHLS